MELPVAPRKTDARPSRPETRVRAMMLHVMSNRAASAWSDAAQLA
jgi:hypothetical protein